jgi:hypothetical protein
MRWQTAAGEDRRSADYRTLRQGLGYGLADSPSLIGSVVLESFEGEVIAVGCETAEAEHTAERQELLGRARRRPLAVPGEQCLNPFGRCLLGGSEAKFDVAPWPGEAGVLEQMGIPVREPA